MSRKTLSMEDFDTVYFPLTECLDANEGGHAKTITEADGLVFNKISPYFV